jgi:hypothetical protein
VIVAVHPQVATDLALRLKGREVEAVLMILLLFMGTNLAWLLFLEHPPEPITLSGTEPSTPARSQGDDRTG